MVVGISTTFILVVEIALRFIFAEWYATWDYPNPSTGLVNIVSNDMLESIMVYNQLGAVVLEQTNVPMNTTIDLSSFGRGLYFINLRNKEGELTSKKVVIL